jgi:hypothetical protein
MARKSRELRLEQAREVFAAYVAAGLGGDRNCRFTGEMINLLENNKALSPKRRKWLDSVIEEGVPDPKGDIKLVEEIEHLLKTDGTQHIRDILLDFLFREKRGWKLSPKQIAFRDRLLDEARAIERDGPWKPSDDEIKKLQICVDMVPSRSQMYWSTHAGESKAVQKISEWLADPENSHIDEWSVSKTLHSFRSGLREMADPYVSPGDMVWGNNGKFYGKMGIVTGQPTISDKGAVSYPVLIDGISLSFPKGYITKRRPKVR